MQVTIDIKDSALDKVMYFLNHLKSDVKIVEKKVTTSLDIEVIAEDDEDYKLMLKCEEDRKNNPQNYGTLNDIKWD